MRIAFVTQEYVTERSFSGGLANYLHRVSLSLLRLGHRPVVIILSDRDETFAHDGVEVHRVRMTRTLPWKVLNRLTRGRYFSSLGILRASRQLCARVMELHARDALSVVQYPHLSGLGIFRPRAIPTVVRLSSYTPLWAAHGEYDHMEPGLLRQFQWLEEQGLRRADGIFGPCRAVAQVVEKDLGKPVDVIETPFVMDAPVTDETVCRELFRNGRYLLFVGRFSVAKGIVAVADAIEEVLERFPDLRFAFVGREGGGYRGAPAMEYVFAKAGKHRGRVFFLGEMRHEFLYPVVENALAVVIPSLVENFPNVCLEAMAHRRTVVGTRATGLEQLIEDGGSGFLCEAGSPASLAEAIGKAVCLSDAARAKMGEKAAERIRDLRPELVVERLLAFYRRVIDRAGAGKNERSSR